MEDAMTNLDRTELYRQYGGCCVAERDGHVIASASTWDDLFDQLERDRVDLSEIIVEYLAPLDVIQIYQVPTLPHVTVSNAPAPYGSSSSSG
jgi:hypothetical protein